MNSTPSLTCLLLMVRIKTNVNDMVLLTSELHGLAAPLEVQHEVELIQLRGTTEQ